MRSGRNHNRVDHPVALRNTSSHVVSGRTAGSVLCHQSSWALQAPHMSGVLEPRGQTQKLAAGQSETHGLRFQVRHTHAEMSFPRSARAFRHEPFFLTSRSTSCLLLLAGGLLRRKTAKLPDDYTSSCRHPKPYIKWNNRQHELDIFDASQQHTTFPMDRPQRATESRS